MLRPIPVPPSTELIQDVRGPPSGDRASEAVESLCDALYPAMFGNDGLGFRGGAIDPARTPVMATTLFARLEA